MPFCNKCGKEISEGSHCTNCKIDHLNSKVEKHKKANWFLFGIIGILVLIIIFFFAFRPGNMAQNISPESKPCPYECCSENSGFELKPCPDLYSCNQGKCIEIDSDNDGLTDIEEKSLGTNPKMADSDNDGLTDYVEVRQTKTGPLNPNTDGDRYKDGEDKEPLKANSAHVIFSKANENGDYNTFNLIKDSVIIAGSTVALGGCAALTIGACAATIPGVMTIVSPILDDVIYTKSFDIIFRNDGDDYTSYANYDISYILNAETITTSSDSIDRLNASESKSKSYSQEIKVRDIPKTIWSLITKKGEISINIENLNYEKFP